MIISPDVVGAGLHNQILVYHALPQSILQAVVALASLQPQHKAL